jgi:hypothetical protein
MENALKDNMKFYPGFDIRASLQDPLSSGPEELYAIVMDVGLNTDREEIVKRNLLFGAVTYAAGTNAVTITVEGYGTVEYEIWIDDICVKEFTIDFSDGQSTVQIKVG